MPLICETVLITTDIDGSPHIAPLGLIADGRRWIAAPFRPSKTSVNLGARPKFVANHTDDARHFAGCLTGRRTWPLVPTHRGYPPRLANVIAHWELEVEEVSEDSSRPLFFCQIRCCAVHASFQGHNRAFAAVIEASVLVSRLHLLPISEIEAEFSHLRNIVGKTGGTREAEAFEWLEVKVREAGVKPLDLGPDP